MEIERYADAIVAGVVSATLKDRLLKAEAERERLERADRAPRPVSNVIRVIPNIETRYERIVGEAERALQSDVAVAREALRAYLGDVKMIPQKGGGLVAEARLDGAVLVRRVLSPNQRDISVVAGV